MGLRLALTLLLLVGLACPAWATQQYAVLMHASAHAYATPDEAWQGFAAGQFQPVDAQMQAMGWAQQPVWLLIRPQAAVPEAERLTLIVSPIPVADLQAWVQASPQGPWLSLGQDGIAAHARSGSARTHGFATVTWPLQHRPDTTVLVRMQGVGISVVSGSLLDSGGLQTMIHLRGIGMGLIACFMIVALAFGLQAFMLSRQREVLAWSVLIAFHAWWLGVYDGMFALALPGVPATALNMLCTAVVVATAAAYTVLALKSCSLLVRGHPWRPWLLASLAGFVPAAIAGQWAWESGLKGVVLWHMGQSALLFGVVLQQVQRRRSRWAVGLLGGSALVVMEWTHAALLGWLPHRIALHSGWQFVQWMLVLYVAFVLLNGTMAERRAARTERERLNSLLQQDKQQLEQHVQQRTQALRQALADLNRLESHQRDLLSLASHEFRTPAAIISSSLEVIDCLPHSVGPDATPYLQSVKAASKRLIFLANKLIDHDRWREMAVKPHLAPLDLGAWVQSQVAQTPPDQGLTMALTTHPMQINADPVLLSIALQNLIDNAQTHTQRGTRIKVRLAHSDTHALLSVEDQGRGVPDHQKPLIFERYFSDRGSPGEVHGLGLSIVQNIVRQHGGEVEVSDASGGGACFTLKLPLLPH